MNKTKFPDLKAMVDYGHSKEVLMGWYENNCICMDSYTVAADPVWYVCLPYSAPVFCTVFATSTSPVSLCVGIQSQRLFPGLSQDTAPPRPPASVGVHADVRMFAGDDVTTFMQGGEDLHWRCVRSHSSSLYLYLHRGRCWVYAERFLTCCAQQFPPPTPEYLTAVAHWSAIDCESCLGAHVCICFYFYPL